MAETSLFWTTNGTGDGSGSGYSSTQVFELWRALFAGHIANLGGVSPDYQNKLAVSGATSPVSVASGAGLVYGIPYINTAAVTVAIPTPASATRIDRIVLRASWAAQTVRITRIAGTEGAGAPSLTQSAGTTWDIPLAQASITTGGAITLTDQREWLSLIGNDAVTTGKIAAGAVGSTDIATDAVTATHIAAGAVGSGELATGAVTAGKIATGGVSAAGQFAAGVVDATALASNAVTTAKILDDNVTQAKIAAGAVGTTELADDAVTTGKIATGAVGNTDLASDSVSTLKIINLAVTTGKINDSAVTTAKINDLAVTTAKLAATAVDGTKIAAGAVGATALATGAVTAGKIATGGVSAAAQLAAGVVANAALATDSVSTLKIVNQAVTAAKIADDNVTNAKIAAGAVDTTELADGAVTTAKIDADAVTSVEVGVAVPALARRQGGHISDWSLHGSTNYTVSTPVRMQCGAIHAVIPANTSGEIAVVFPTAFSAAPVVVATPIIGSTKRRFYVDNVSTTGFTLYWDGELTTVEAFNWIAVGPE